MGWVYPQYRELIDLGTYDGSICVFPKIGVPQNAGFIMENLIEIDELGLPLFLETPIWTFYSPTFWVGPPESDRRTIPRCWQPDLLDHPRRLGPDVFGKSWDIGTSKPTKFWINRGMSWKLWPRLCLTVYHIYHISIMLLLMPVVSCDITLYILYRLLCHYFYHEQYRW